jgi:putative oxidoreductase
MINKTVGIFIIRVLLGLIFLMQGFGKVFTWGLDEVYENGFKAYEATFLPKFALYFAAYFTSYTELIGGLLLIIGLFRNYALYALGAVLLIVTFGHGLSSPIWDLSHVMPRAILLVSLLLLPEEWDQWQFGKLLKKK